MSASALRSPRQPGHSTPATGSCAYFEDAYPAQHARLLSEGRLLLYCPSSSGFGAWLFGLQSLVAASVLTERALILAWVRHVRGRPRRREDHPQVVSWQRL